MEEVPLPPLTPGFAPFDARMRAEGLPEIVIRTFEHYYAQLAEGRTGLVPEREIAPVDSVPDAETFSPHLGEVGRAALPQAVVIKLNGGLGTGMGMDRPKSLLTVKDGLTFLDIIARQARDVGVPLVLMNSFSTRTESLAALQPYLLPERAIPPDFVQHKVPKIAQVDLHPVTWPREPELEWCPPGHGDLYTALVTSGMLDTLLEHRIRYAFVSNADNLGAVIDATILGYFVEESLPFLMEVADRTPADRKGGHLARRLDGQFVLRESAQCPEEDIPSFQDIQRHRYFNTNNLWIDLIAFRDIMAAKGNILGLPMIRNTKTVDPRDRTSPHVYQLETAMGAAIAVFPGAGAVRVPRRRFAPVKTTDDLLAVRSDAYILGDGWRVLPNPERSLGTPVVTLDPAYYRMIDELEERFPHGAPSLLKCSRLELHGDIRFGRGVRLIGDVRLVNSATAPMQIEDGAIIDDGTIIEGLRE